MKYDVFISYSSDDQKVVEGLCAYLEAQKIRCFVAYRDIPRGVVWARAIVEALDESRMMVVVFSANFNRSEQVDREIELASEDKKPILTFRITDDAFKGAKKYYLTNLNWIDAFPDPEAVFGSVAESVAKLLNMPLSTATTAAATPPQQQPVAPSKTYQVGDYYNDGTKEGVVFWVDKTGRHGKIVSMTQSSEKLQWSSSKSEQERLIGASSKTDGATNMRAVQIQPNWHENYPAFAWCTDLGDGWYLPAIEELKLFTLNDSVYDVVNRTLNSKGGTKLFNQSYWSSTVENELYAWVISIYCRYIHHGYKFDDRTYSVRAVSAF